MAAAGAALAALLAATVLPAKGVVKRRTTS